MEHEDRRRVDVGDRLKELLEEDGVHSVLAFLNARTTHRFTGLYLFDPPMLRNIQIYDRENPDLEIGEDAPLRETYCSIVGRESAPFSTPDAGRDGRLEGHPAREATLSYFGVPLRTADEAPMGTLCHFDVAPRPEAEPELELMEAAASVIVRHLADRGV